MQEQTMLSFIKMMIERFDNKIDDLKKRDAEHQQRCIRFEGICELLRKSSK